MKEKKVFLVFKITLMLVLIVGIANYFNLFDRDQGSRVELSSPGEEYADIRKLEPESRAQTKNPDKQKDTRDTDQARPIPKDPAEHSSEDSRDNAIFGVALNTQGTGFDRVLQSFAFDENTGEIYTVQDESNSNNNLLVNKLNSDGKSLGHITLTKFGHGNGLGLERLPDNSIRLWTDYIPVDSKGYGTKIVRFNYDNPSEITSYDLCPPGYKVPFVAIENDSRTLLLRVVNKKTKAEEIYVFSLDEVLEGGTTAKFSFNVDPAQQAQSFQGLHAKDKVVYILTGDSSIYTPKLLYGYDFSGKVLFKKKIEAGKNYAANNGEYYEPEGLYVNKDSKTGIKRLYVGIVSGLPAAAKSNPKGKINRLYYYEDLD